MSKSKFLTGIMGTVFGIMLPLANVTFAQIGPAVADAANESTQSVIAIDEGTVSVAVDEAGVLVMEGVAADHQEEMGAEHALLKADTPLCQKSPQLWHCLTI